MRHFGEAAKKGIAAAAVQEEEAKAIVVVGGGAGQIGFHHGSGARIDENEGTL